MRADLTRKEVNEPSRNCLAFGLQTRLSTEAKRRIDAVKRPLLARVHLSMIKSPYEGIEATSWRACTEDLIGKHSLKGAEIVKAVLSSWEAIFDSNIAGYQIGKQISPKPQIMGFLLHEILSYKLSEIHPNVWRPEASAEDKDVNYIPDDFFSIEVKTSSNASKIFGNRSYAQVGSSSKKGKNGYYIAVNFGKFLTTKDGPKPVVNLIRFGWLDGTDWKGQKAATGQQASLTSDAEKYKLIELYKAEKPPKDPKPPKPPKLPKAPRASK